MKLIIKIAGLSLLLFSLNNISLISSKEANAQNSAIPVENFVPSVPCPEGFDECGVCNGPGRDECGNCPGDSPQISKDECGICDGPGKDECGNCPGDDPQIVKDECGVCGGDGKDECGNCPGIVIQL